MGSFERLTVIIICTSLAIVSLAALFILYYIYLPSLETASYASLPLLGPHVDISSSIPISGIQGAVFLLCGSIVAHILKKSKNPEINFFIFGLFAFAGLGVYNLSPVLYIIGLPFPLAVFTVRIFYLLWIFGTLMMFLAGLFCFSIFQMKPHMFLITAAVGSAMIALIMPLDTLHILRVFPFVAVTEDMLPLFIRIIAGLGVLSFLGAGIHHSSRRYVGAGIGLLLVFIGNNSGFSQSLLRSAAGSVMIIMGTILYVYMIYTEYMWS